MDLETRYIARLLRAFVHETSQPVEVPAGIDWRLLTSLLESHRILPTVFSEILRSDIPEPVRNEMEGKSKLLRLRSELLLLELARFLPSLEETCGSVMVLKGAALALSAYPSTGLRTFVDLDILLPKDRIEPGFELLQRFGYKDAPFVQHEDFYTRYHFHRILRNRQGIAVELHWDLTRPRSHVRFDLAGLVDRGRVVSMGDVDVRIPDNVDTLLHTASQAERQGYADLRRIVDAALLVRMGTAEKPSLVESARSQGLSTSLWILLSLTEQIAGIAASPELMQRLKPSMVPRVCIVSLDLPRKTVSAFTTRRSGFRQLAHWLVCPTPYIAFREIIHYAFPGKVTFIEAGFTPINPPSILQRATILATHILSTAKLIAYQIWRLATLQRPTRYD